MAEKLVAPGAGVMILNDTTDENEQDITISHMVCTDPSNVGLYTLSDNHGNVVARYRTTTSDPTGIVPINRTIKGGVITTALPVDGTSEIEVHVVKEPRLWR